MGFSIGSLALNSAYADNTKGPGAVVAGSTLLFKNAAPRSTAASKRGTPDDFFSPVAIDTLKHRIPRKTKAIRLCIGFTYRPLKRTAKGNCTENQTGACDRTAATVECQRAFEAYDPGGCNCFPSLESEFIRLPRQNPRWDFLFLRKSR